MALDIHPTSISDRGNDEHRIIKLALTEPIARGIQTKEFVQGMQPVMEFDPGITKRHHVTACDRVRHPVSIVQAKHMRHARNSAGYIRAGSAADRHANDDILFFLLSYWPGF